MESGLGSPFHKQIGDGVALLLYSKQVNAGSGTRPTAINVRRIVLLRSLFVRK
jgi:hypothetical protein